MVESYLLVKLKRWLEYYFDISKHIEESPYIFTFKDFAMVFACTLSLFTVSWIISIFTLDVTLIDFCWGFSLAIQSFLYFFQSFNYTGKFSSPKLIFSLLQFINGVRLGIYLIVRSHNKQEDKRYALIRRKIGNLFPYISYFLLFLPQLFVNTTLGLTLYEFNNVNNKAMNLKLFILGTTLMLFGTLFQSIADHQLYKFKSDSNNKGKIFHKGLWGLCRHPNYFGDTVNWWGIYLCNASVGIYYTVICPIIFTCGILFLHGVPLLEYFMKSDYGGLYENYMNNVSAFVPWLFNTKEYKEDLSSKLDSKTIVKKNKKKERKKSNKIHKISHIPRKQNKIMSNILNQNKKKNKFMINNISRKNFHRVQ